MQKQRRIFVVDDEPIIATTLALILRRKGFDAVHFTDPFEALKACHLDSPDLLIQTR
jgi:DNA-binding response OmpR family regulator